MKLCGIYEIRCRVSENAYVGSSISVYGRWYDHRWNLRKGTHHCHALQKSWIKHGEAAFDFKILELCTQEELVNREQTWLDTGSYVYNSSQKVFGVTDSMRAMAREHAINVLCKIEWTPERRLAASLRGKGRKQPPDTPETKLKRSESAKRRKARDKANGVPGPWTIRRSKEPPRLCACGCGTRIGRKRTWSRGHNNKFGKGETAKRLLAACPEEVY